MLQDILNSANPKMEKVVTALQDEFRGLHTGKASATLVEDILVDYYGTKVPLKQMAQITAPQANQIVIIPFDKNALKDIETSIRNSELSLNPIGESNQVRLVLPPLSEERRKELTKAIHSKAEQSKVVLRNIRKIAWEEIQNEQKNGQITEDDKYQGQDELNKAIKDFDLKIDKISEDKAHDIMTV